MYASRPQATQASSTAAARDHAPPRMHSEHPIVLEPSVSTDVRFHRVLPHHRRKFHLQSADAPPSMCTCHSAVVFLVRYDSQCHPLIRDTSIINSVLTRPDRTRSGQRRQVEVLVPRLGGFRRHVRAYDRHEAPRGCGGPRRDVAEFQPVKVKSSTVSVCANRSRTT